MPLYEYECTHCGTRRDIMESVAEMEATKDSKRCVACESLMRKLMSTPTLFTETRFFAKRLAKGDDGFGNDHRGRAMAKKLAAEQGVSTAGKIFMPTLVPKGEFFSPKAWVGDAGDIRRAANQANVNVRSSCVNVQQREPGIEMRPYRVADDIVERKVQEAVDDHHGGRVTPKTRATMREAIREQITPPHQSLVPHEVTQ